MDEESPAKQGDQLRAGLQLLTDLARQVTETAQSWTAGAAARTPGSDLLIRYAEQLSAVPRLWVQPLRRIVEEQLRLAELMASWAEQHRKLAEQLAQSAEHLRKLAEDGAALIDPMLTYTERLSDVADSWVDLFRPPDPA